MSSANLPQVEYRRLGKSGLRVSVPIVGAMSFGSSKWGDWVLDEEEALPILKYAYDRGVNTWDTANAYSNGWSEKVIAAAIKKYQIPREKVIILTKVFGLVADSPEVQTVTMPELRTTPNYINQSGLSRQAIFNAVNASLARLETSYIDLLQIHRFDKDTPMEETMEALHDLVKAGKVRYIGASSMWTWQFVLLNEIAEKRGWTKFVSMQNHYSLLYREEEREMNAYCNHAGIGLIPWGPLFSGQLARPVGAGETKRTEFLKGTIFERKQGEVDKEIISRVEKVAKEKGWKMSQVALSWIGTKVSSPIVGISSPQRLEEAIVVGKHLTPEEIKYLEEPYQPRKPIGHA
ncbi:Aldo/keto reductase [Sistotremastrum niveocremeum HHB9708]|uniref:Aldo/keto reductase n=2 Tax=Sistotremastraceae TaxID=3402574 RepID=A0A164P856_9AGAM|nr:Aldo/keto reductase [Sistotremastrum niveocremeum HHB9708]KZT34666.1 Aldo/keto reductase [Sistotremastrum suecicum HHB10207 ss-3]